MEKFFSPSPKRLQKLFEEGQSPESRYLASFLSAGVVCLFCFILIKETLLIFESLWMSFPAGPLNWSILLDEAHIFKFSPLLHIFLMFCFALLATRILSKLVFRHFKVKGSFKCNFSKIFHPKIELSFSAWKMFSRSNLFFTGGAILFVPALLLPLCFVAPNVDFGEYFTDFSLLKSHMIFVFVSLSLFLLVLGSLEFWWKRSAFMRTNQMSYLDIKNEQEEQASKKA